MRIYLTDLASYNNGHLLGEWIDLPSTDLEGDIRRVLAKGDAVELKEYGELTYPHEEYFITDYECDYYDIDEYESLDTLNDLAEKMSNLDEDQATAVKLMLENYIVDGIDNAIEHLDDIYNTGQLTMEDVAYSYIEETGTLEAMPSNMRYYFDYDALGRDMEINGTYLEDDEGYLWEYVA